ncbi:hypothetical protein KAR48_11310 [bacterium]|nr:hypothetical protein [bacterium]
MFFKKMAYSLITLTLIVAISGCHIVDPWNDHQGNIEVSASFDFLINAAQRNRLNIDAINGPITIIGDANTESLHIRGERIVKSDSESDARYHLDDLSISIIENSSSVTIETEQPNHTNGRQYIVEYQIRVPIDWKAYIDLVNGTIQMDSLSNKFNFNLTNGNVYFKNIEGSVYGDLVNGNANGSLNLPANGECLIGLTNGQLDLSIPSSTSANLDANVVNGSISIDGLDLDGFTIGNKHISGVWGNGNGRIRLNVVNGRINIKGR